MSFLNRPIQVIQVPYDSGAPHAGMGKGPRHFVENGLLARLESQGCDVRETVIKAEEDVKREIGTTFDLLRSIAKAVRSAAREGAFPLLLAGNCISTAGALSGLASRRPGLVWFDAHADFNTPETSTTGFLDGMGLAMITGRCWKPLARSIPGFQPLEDERVLLAGARDFDETEAARLNESGVAQVKWEDIRRNGPETALAPHLKTLGGRVEEVYVHVDMDVHDPRLAPANRFRPSGGLSPGDVQDVLRYIAEGFRICGASVTAFDPDWDEDRKGLQTGIQLIGLIVELAVSP